LVGSYGSGAQAEIHIETVRENWCEEVDQLNLQDQLDRRYDLDFEENEQVHDAHNLEKNIEIEQFTTPQDEFVFTGWGQMNERCYEYIK
jgi:hydroxymethylglutaryl-CoA synthase